MNANTQNPSYANMYETGAHTHNITPSTSPPVQAHSLDDMLAMRLRIYKAGDPAKNWAHAAGLGHISIQPYNDTVFVWIITKDGKSIVLEDGRSIFPSDTLVTKINLLKSEA